MRCKWRNRFYAWLLIPGLMLCCFWDAQAQTDVGDQRGRWAMQFAIDQNFDINSFQGSTLSIKNHTSPARAWRLGLSISVSIDDDESQQWQADSLYRGTDADRRYYNLGMVVQRVWLITPLRTTSFYWGIGPSWRLQRSTSESSETGTARVSEYELTGWGMGLAGTVGVEWYVSRSISVIAEYGSRIEYDYRKTTSTRTDPERPEYNRKSESVSKDYGFGSSAVRLGASVYF